MTPTERFIPRLLAYLCFLGYLKVDWEADTSLSAPSLVKSALSLDSGAWNSICFYTTLHLLISYSYSLALFQCVFCPVFLTSLTTSWQWQVAALSSDWLLRGGHMIVISFSGVLICEYWCDWMIVCHSVSSLWQSRTYLGLNNLSPYDSWHRILLG